MSGSTMSHAKVRDLAYIALMAALLAVCAWIVLPFGPVPFTMQTFGVFAAVGLLGGRRGTMAVVLYLLLGLVGLPVFSGFTAGLGALMGATGGYLLGFLVAALFYWAVTASFGTRLPVMLAAMLVGLVLCYAFGTLWFVGVYTAGGKAATILGTLAACVFPYLIPDLLKIALAILVTKRVGGQVRGRA